MKMRYALIAAAALLICTLCISGSDASEVNSDGAEYVYETHGSGHPNYYCVITSASKVPDLLYLPSVLEGYDVRTYASHAFDGCGMETVIIPKNLKTIEDDAFTGCTSPKDVYFMGDRPEIGDSFLDGVTFHSLQDATGWTGTETIESVTADGIEYAFLPDGAVVTGGFPIEGVITIPSKIDGRDVVRIGDYAFAGAMQDDGEVDRRNDIGQAILPEGLLSIGQRAFYYNDVMDVNIPESVRDVQDEAFRACERLEEVEFSKNLRYIGFEAYRDCHAIIELNIPGTVEFMGDGAFYICKNLRTLKVDTDIGPRTFGYCVSLEEMTLGGSVSEIGSFSFYNCENLRSVRIPDKVETIGGEAFRGCSGLRSVDLNDVREIGRMAFRGCESLRSLAIPASVETIGGYAFADCIRLTEIDAYGKAPEGNDTVFLNVDAKIHCKESYEDSWNGSGFGLEVIGDLDGDEDELPIKVIAAIAILAALAAFSCVIVMKIRRSKRS